MGNGHPESHNVERARSKLFLLTEVCCRANGRGYGPIQPHRIVRLKHHFQTEGREIVETLKRDLNLALALGEFTYSCLASAGAGEGSYPRGGSSQ